MKYAINLFKGVFKIIQGNPKSLTSVEKILETKPLLTMGEKAVKNNIATFKIKPDISMPINPETLHMKNPSFTIDGNLIKSKNALHQAELGNTAIRLSERFEKALLNAKREISSIFPGQEFSVRSKSANSIYSKLENKATKNGLQISSDNQATKMIGDAIGGRITMKNLTAKDVKETLDSLKIEGKNLTRNEKDILLKLFKGENVSNKELKQVNKLIRQTKLALAEKQSDPVVKNILASSYQKAINEGKITIKELEKSGIRADVIQELNSGKKITPMEITELNNYIGKDGIPYFTDAQIADLREMQALTKKPFDIISRPEAQRYSKSLTEFEKSAIKESGYTTSQMNIRLSDGTLAEIQIRGKGPFGEIEHIAYDARQGKNTLSSTFDTYKEAVGKLTDDQYKRYNKYLRACYNYYRNAELNIKTPKPKLPAGFPEILNEESMKALHEIDDKITKTKLKTFRPQIEYKNLELVA